MHEIQFPEELAEQLKERLLRADFEAWSDQVASARQCSRPVRLFGHSTRFDPSTGAATSFLDSRTMPDGVLHVRCGNRRTSACPSCSHEYKGDMWHLLSAGVAGGSKGVPESVAKHPMVFATLTAPSFGPVHSASRPGSARRCHPRSSDQRCKHGQPTSCAQVHRAEDPRVGEPICKDCYDYEGHIIWQWWAPELWRRFTIATRRLLAASCGMSESRSRDVVRLQFAKVAEFQKRGAIHFHALIRLDGAPTDEDPFPAPAVPLTASVLAELVHEAAQTVTFEAPAPLAGSLPRMLRFGSQVDARAVHRESDSTDVSPDIRCRFSQRLQDIHSEGAIVSRVEQSWDVRRSSQLFQLQTSRRLLLPAFQRSESYCHRHRESFWCTIASKLHLLEKRCQCELYLPLELPPTHGEQTLRLEWEIRIQSQCWRQLRYCDSHHSIRVCCDERRELAQSDTT